VGVSQREPRLDLHVHLQRNAAAHRDRDDLVNAQAHRVGDGARLERVVERRIALRREVHLDFLDLGIPGADAIADFPGDGVGVIGGGGGLDLRVDIDENAVRRTTAAHAHGLFQAGHPFQGGFDPTRIERLTIGQDVAGPPDDREPGARDDAYDHDGDDDIDHGIPQSRDRQAYDHRQRDVEIAGGVGRVGQQNVRAQRGAFPSLVQRDGQVHDHRADHDPKTGRCDARASPVQNPVDCGLDDFPRSDEQQAPNRQRGERFKAAVPVRVILIRRLGGELGAHQAKHVGRGVHRGVKAIGDHRNGAGCQPDRHFGDCDCCVQQ